MTPGHAITGERAKPASTSISSIAVLDTRSGFLCRFHGGRRGITRRVGLLRGALWHRVGNSRGGPGRGKLGVLKLKSRARLHRREAIRVQVEDAGSQGRWSGRSRNVGCPAETRGSRGARRQPSSSRAALTGIRIGAEMNRARQEGQRLIRECQGAGWSPPRKSWIIAWIRGARTRWLARDHTNGSERPASAGEASSPAVAAAGAAMLAPGGLTHQCGPLGRL